MNKDGIYTAFTPKETSPLPPPPPLPHILWDSSVQKPVPQRAATTLLSPDTQSIT